MEYVEAEGNSIDEAIGRALELLGVSREKADIDILSNSTRGLFGFGGRRAKVRATLRRPLAVDGSTVSPAGRSTVTPPPAASPPPPREVRARPTAPGGDAPRRPRPRPPARPTERRPSRSHAAEAAPVQPDDHLPAAPVDGAVLERARTILAELVRLIGSEGTVEAAADTDGVHLVIRGDPSGTLIGRRGQTLDALEYVVNRILAHEEDGSARLVIDAEGYRVRRRQALEELALRVAERARRRGKPVTLNPMSPRDRRIVHLTLQDDPTIATRSAGSGFYRKVVVVPEGSGSRRR